ncbi:hypothetical protein CVS40_12803 [Lucilia cuprina]|nr:hypothetical protein CVS40_12803 [Lucilia cuprina]
MPNPIRSVLCAMTEYNLETLAKKADLIYSTFKQYPVYTINETTINTNIYEEISVKQLVAQIKLLSDRIENPSQQNNDTTNQNSQKDTNSKYCWYHRRFGKNATRCATPCSYPKN